MVYPLQILFVSLTILFLLSVGLCGVYLLTGVYQLVAGMKENDYAKAQRGMLVLMIATAIMTGITYSYLTWIWVW